MVLCVTCKQLLQFGRYYICCRSCCMFIQNMSRSVHSNLCKKSKLRPSLTRMYVNALAKFRVTTSIYLMGKPDYLPITTFILDLVCCIHVANMRSVLGDILIDFGNALIIIKRPTEGDIWTIFSLLCLLCKLPMEGLDNYECTHVVAMYVVSCITSGKCDIDIRCKMLNHCVIIPPWLHAVLIWEWVGTRERDGVGS